MSPFFTPLRSSPFCSRIWLAYEPRVDLSDPEVFSSVSKLLIRHQDPILLLILSHEYTTTNSSAVNKLLTKVIRLNAVECTLSILDLSTVIECPDALIKLALDLMHGKIAEVLLSHEKSKPAHPLSFLEGAIDQDTTGGLLSLLQDQRVKDMLPLTDKVFLLLCVRGVSEDELVEDYLSRAIDNLRAGEIEINKDLSRSQLKELARKMGYSIHSAMGNDELLSLISPK